MSKRFEYRNVVLLIMIFFQTACNKLVEISPPVNTITSTDTFSDSANANAAILGIYTNMINTSGAYNIGCGAVTILCGLSADELVNFDPDPQVTQLYNNNVTANNGLPFNNLWSPAYQFIYQANASIEGITNSAGISPTAKAKFIGEAKFIRAFLYFYLVNLYGDVPIVTTIDFKSSSLGSRAPKSDVYDFIINDLKDAQNLLPDDYSYYAGGERTRATKWAATALLSRVYLYLGNWQNAELQSTSVIDNSSFFTLAEEPSQVFLINSPEAILQWKLNTLRGINNVTPEGYEFIPPDSTSNPFYYLNTELLNDFEIDDLRKTEWIGSTTYDGVVYYYPYKYKTGRVEREANADATEYYMVLRLAEQYLIRAEARAEMGSNLDGAVNDINVIRLRSKLPGLPSGSLTQAEVLTAVNQERRIEFFAEWGNRWLDLKRTGKVDNVLSAVKPAWKSYQQLYPIAISELLSDPNLTQNPGY